METNYILGFICLLLAWVTSFLFGTLTYILISVYVVLFNLNDYRDGQIDALKGKYKYRMEINYDQHGTPKDTIYVKEEWRKNMEKDTVVIIPIRTVRDTVIYINR